MSAEEMTMDESIVLIVMFGVMMIVILSVLLGSYGIGWRLAEYSENRKRRKANRIWKHCKEKWFDKCPEFHFDPQQCQGCVYILDSYKRLPHRRVVDSSAGDNFGPRPPCTKCREVDEWMDTMSAYGRAHTCTECPHRKKEEKNVRSA